MTTPMRNRMRRHTRPADFVSKSRQAEAMAFCRPGGRSFSFTGEFPDMQDQQPVEASSRRRQYTSGSSTGSYHAVRHDDTARTPAVSKYGVRFMPAVVMLAVLAIFLFSIFGVHMDERERISNAIDAKRDRITVLEVQCGQTRDQIATQSNDVNIRQEAVRMGLISSKGVRVNYLQAPTDAVITLTGTNGITALASIWGN
ncbi:MAG: hypothetical protein E7318_11020 [Clostridiales bacterium]|nr:hypothetical protein [Clostridiales bacterium]